MFHVLYFPRSITQVQAYSSQSLRNTYFMDMLKSRGVDRVCSKAQEIYSAAIKAVSPVSLVSQSLQFDRATNFLTVEDKIYQLNRCGY